MSELRSPNGEWAIVFAVNGSRSTHQVALDLGLPVERVLAALRLVEGSGLMAGTEISCREYLRDSGSGPESERTSRLAEFLAKNPGAPVGWGRRG